MGDGVRAGSVAVASTAKAVEEAQEALRCLVEHVHEQHVGRVAQHPSDSAEEVVTADD